MTIYLSLFPKCNSSEFYFNPVGKEKAGASLFTISQVIAGKHCSVDEGLQNQDPEVLDKLKKYAISTAGAVDSGYASCRGFLIC